jgi:P-type Ca2+ transporter type 2C
VSTSAAVQLGLVYVPFLQHIFHTAALDFSDLSIILGLAGVSFVLHELRRRFERKIVAEETFVTTMEELA